MKVNQQLLVYFEHLQGHVKKTKETIINVSVAFKAYLWEHNVLL